MISGKSTSDLNHSPKKKFRPKPQMKKAKHHVSLCFPFPFCFWLPFLYEKVMQHILIGG
jgi:hypothetical protein